MHSKIVGYKMKYLYKAIKNFEGELEIRLHFLDYTF